MSHSLIQRLSRQLELLEQNTEQIKNKIAKQNLPVIPLISYFSYSINYSHTGSHHLLLGHFTIRNTGYETIDHPYICIQLPESGLLQLNGKIVTPNNKTKMQHDAWERFTEEGLSTNYWLKPVYQRQIDPGDSIAFSNFQLKWLSSKPYQANVTAHVYSDQTKDGISSLNSISISSQ